MMEDDALEILRRAHAEAIGEAHYAAVRNRVAVELGARRRRQRAWKLLFAAVAALLCLAFWPKPARRAPAIARRVAAVQMAMPPADPIAHAVESLGYRYKRRAPSRRGEAAQRAPRPIPLPYTVVGPPVPQPLIVKLVTDDPNVVIYWISEKSGE